jgi:hypothetical protein
VSEVIPFSGELLPGQEHIDEVVLTPSQRYVYHLDQYSDVNKTPSARSENNLRTPTLREIQLQNIELIKAQENQQQQQQQQQYPLVPEAETVVHISAARNNATALLARNDRLELENTRLKFDLDTTAGDEGTVMALQAALFRVHSTYQYKLNNARRDRDDDHKHYVVLKQANYALQQENYALKQSLQSDQQVAINIEAKHAQLQELFKAKQVDLVASHRTTEHLRLQLQKADIEHAPCIEREGIVAQMTALLNQRDGQNSLLTSQTRSLSAALAAEKNTTKMLQNQVLHLQESLTTAIDDHADCGASMTRYRGYTPKSERLLR